MILPLRAFATRRLSPLVALTLAFAAGGALAQTTPDGRFPVTSEQRGTADKVAAAGVPLSDLAPNAPDTYTVKTKDTLWDISGVFLKTQWRWPELWGMNKEQVSNPHLIYPGQVLVLVKTGDRASLRFADGSSAPVGGSAEPVSVDATRSQLPGSPGQTVKLSPQVRTLDGERGGGAVWSIPNNVIEPFLSMPIVVAAKELDAYPRIVATQEGRVYLGRGDTAYARGIKDDRVENYHVFRPATPLYDPDDTARRRPIAYEAFYLGTLRMIKRGDVATLQVADSKREIGVGDRLVPIERQPLINYVPRAPERNMSGRIVSVYGGVDQAGGLSIVTLNRGAAEGLEIGHVLALIKTGETIRDRTADNERVKLPDERIGEIFVFRVFDNVSYALVMRTTLPLKVGDRFTEPDGPLLPPRRVYSNQPQTVSPTGR